ncbi:Methylated-DNA--protein-cysteine methyltransferase [hydrothermal vent metagenome]|uniref:methylated-DNA--[protein]-cysteine S-methyltransferase n=1 Tax=hydrothermal vent metagenome TaxID=652676 RepID=A0A3B1BWJ2_9ZZZZ
MPDNHKQWMTVKTAFGYVGVGFSGGKVAKLWLPAGNLKKLESDIRKWVPTGAKTRDAQLAKKLADYFNGKPVTFGNKLIFQKANSFSNAILTSLLKVKWGKTTTYGELAERAGFKGAGRAVGSVMAKNEIPLIIPCHRVIRADGALGGFSGPGGVTLKKRMLELEGHYQK